MLLMNLARLLIRHCTQHENPTTTHNTASPLHFDRHSNRKGGEMQSHGTRKRGRIILAEASYS